MTHIDNVLNHTLHDAEFMRFLKELKIRKKFFKNLLESKTGKRNEEKRTIQKCDYILTAFVWDYNGNWDKVNGFWKTYIGQPINNKRDLIRIAKKVLFNND